MPETIDLAHARKLLAAMTPGEWEDFKIYHFRRRSEVVRDGYRAKPLSGDIDALNEEEVAVQWLGNHAAELLAAVKRARELEAEIEQQARTRWHASLSAECSRLEKSAREDAKRIGELEAACAALRESLSVLRSYAGHILYPLGAFDKADAALASDAGRAYLQRMQELEEENKRLKHALDNYV